MHPHPNPVRPRSVSDYLVILGGGDLSILADCPQDRNAARRAGINICSVGFVAGFSAAFMLHMAFHLGPVASALGGAAWGGLVIAPLDALLVSVLHRQNRASLTVALAVPRLLLAFVVAFVVGVPLSLQIFSPEIGAQINADQQSTIQAFHKQLDKNPEFAAIPGLQTQITQLQQTEQSDSPPNVNADPTVQADQARVDTLQNKYAQAEQLVGCEADGTCGTHQAGDGPAAAADQTAANQLAAQLAQAQGQLQKDQAAASSDSAASVAARKAAAAAQLPKLEQQLATAQADKTALLAKENAAVAASTGVAARMEALWKLGLTYPEVAILHIAIVLLAMGIETVPILTKTISLLGKESLSERLTRIRDDDLAERHRIEAERGRQLDEELFEAQRGIALEEHEALYRDLYRAWADGVRADFHANPQSYLVLPN